MTPIQMPLDMTDPLAPAIAALRADLIADGGPRVSTMRNHPFAILPYPPEQEFPLRRAVQRLASELRSAGWVVLSLDVQQLLLDRVAKAEGGFREATIASERRQFSRSPERALQHLCDRLTSLVEGPDGLAADVIQHINKFADEHPERAGRAVVFLGRVGALYPFARSSALLKHVGGHTRGIPVIVLYPGKQVGAADGRRESKALSFMGILPPDRDYRPRIYP